MHNDQHPHPFQREEHRRHFERIVDEALHLDETAKALAASTDLNAEQLRTAALKHADSIAAKADAEYQRFVDSEQRSAATEAAPADAADDDGEGVGVFALTTSITIIVAAISAAVFLAAYYLIKVSTDHDDSVAPMRLVGLASLAIALGTAVVAGFAMLFTAGRNRRTPQPDTAVRLARDEWHAAVLHRGVLPFMSTLLAATPGAQGQVLPFQSPRANKGNGRRPRDREPEPEQDDDQAGDLVL